MTSEVTSDFKIELSDLNCLCVHASLACKGEDVDSCSLFVPEHGNVGGYSLLMVSEVTNGLIIEVNDLNNLHLP